jgi:hypothetical protein
VRYHGAFAPAAKLREHVTLVKAARDDGNPDCRRSVVSRRRWADRLRRIFTVGALVRGSCGGKR